MVVGAGIGGLAAAHQLVAAGRKVAVLEARRRLGGRLLSVDAGGTGLDLGATWFWPGELRIARITQTLGVAAFPQHVDGDAVYHRPQGAERLKGNPVDVPAGRFEAGAQALANAVAAQLPAGAVRLAQRVTAVHATGEGIEAQTPSGVCGGAHLVLAVPPALALATIEFSPALPEPLAALARDTPVWMGAITKVVAHYARAFWRDAGLAGAGISHIGPMREIHDMSGPEGEPAALFGFVPATRAGEATVTEAEILAQLVSLFGAQAGTPKALHIKDWRSERYTSPPDVELLGDYRTYGHRSFALPALGGRLHWASTETASDSPGHIEGALAAAERAAGMILAASEGQRPIACSRLC